MQIRLERGNNTSAIGGGGPRCNHNPSWLCPTCYPNGYGQRDTGSSTTDNTDSTHNNSGNQDSRNSNPSTKC